MTQPTRGGDEYRKRVDKQKLGPRTTEASVEAMPVDARTEIVQRLNEEYAVILIGSGVGVLHEGEDAQGRPEIRVLGMDAFKEWTRPQKYFPPDGGKLQASTIWLNDSRRRQYAGFDFAPGDDVAPGHYNLWKGFAVEPSEKGSCQRFIDHVAENICDGDEKRFMWVMGWFASLFQRPAHKLGTSLVFRGQQGAGKTIVGEQIGKLLGAHYQLVSDDRFVTGRFNSHLANCLLLFLDEATWGGDHAAAGKLKDLITGSTQMIEYKGKEPIRIRNYTRVLISSNNDWVVPAGLQERRFCMLDVGTRRAQDTTYFKALVDEMEDGGRARLLRYLLDFDTTDIPLNQPVATSALREQQVAGLSPELAWWIDVLMRAQLPGDTDGSGVATCDAIHADYAEHAQRRGISRRASQTALGLFLRRHLNDDGRFRRTKKQMIVSGQGPTRPYVYEFPPLRVCRAAAAEYFRGDPPWSDDGDAQWGEAQ